MATAERDYYELLGIDRSATEAEIKRAFRKLARELHPDVSEAHDAHERFREVAQAYEVLSNAETRELYDRYGHAGLRRGGFTPTDFDFGSLSDIFSAFFGDDLFGATTRQRRARGADVGTVVEIELAEAFTGVKKTISVEVAVTCATCAGDGAAPGTGRVTCSGCGGAGRLQQVSRSIFGEFVRTQACPRCGGAGTVVERPCEACDGAGRIVDERAFPVEIPAGIHDGQQIRIRGEGHAGRGGPPGDVFVEVRVRPDPRFVRDGDDIVPPWTSRSTGCARGARNRADARRRRGARAAGRDAAGRGARAARAGDAVPPGPGPRQPARPRERARAEAADRRAAPAARGVRALGRRGHLPAGRGLFRPAAQRVQLRGLRRVSVTVAPERAEEARARLLELFPQGFEEREAGGGVELAAYTDSDGEARVRRAFRAAEGEDVEPGWEDRWRDFHRPVRIGELWVGPPWEVAPAGVVAVVIDPGRAFGTGAHATTRLCLELVLAQPRGSLLDVGCGSGVLAIAAAKLGFAPVTALDDDPVAVEVAAQNAGLNDARIELALIDATAAPLPAADLVVANIALAPLRALAGRLDCARAITSGYLEQDELALPGFRRLGRLAAEGWAADLHERK